MAIDRDVLRGWYNSEPVHIWLPMLYREKIAQFFGPEDVYEDLIHECTEDDDAEEDTLEWICFLIDRAPLAVPYLSNDFELWAGGIGGGQDEPDYVRYVAGHGNFDSSFPLLIYQTEDREKMRQHRQNWRRTRQQD